MTQPGHDKVGTTRPGRVTTTLWARSYSALCERITWPGRVHDKDVSVTEEFCRDRDFPVVTNLDSDKKKKKTPKIWGVIAWYHNLGIRIPRTRWAWV